MKSLVQYISENKKFNIQVPSNILDSTRNGLKSGKITMKQAQEDLYKAGWFSYLPSEKQVEKLLKDTEPRK